ncbi:hypothetical protein ATL39_1971 [Sinobaca qinghaiensis]|uniref:CopG family transcriptional regulator/antitoxin EndoAI n=1 Tax=Sinobaca qinghaiensis TaxID=342944 RepID=A0A419V2M1_9BACL|nr:hypothetical protein [Sinobaca qinghaiensis]RKD72775.1 hypothetical protein ATL39_1971 [Sinobaca qinghaiensis]
MSPFHQVAFELREDLYSEIKHLTDQEKDSFFHDVLLDQIKKRKSRDMQEKMKQGYLEMAQLNAQVCREFEEAESEALTVGELVLAAK